MFKMTECQFTCQKEEEIEELKNLVHELIKTNKEMTDTFQTLKDAEGFFKTVDRVGVWAKKMGFFAVCVGGIIWIINHVSHSVIK